MHYLRVIVFPVMLLLAAGVSAEREDSMSIGQLFQLETSFGDSGFKGENISWGKEIPLYKRYKDAVTIKLPDPSFRGMILEEAIQKRKSVRSFSKKSLTLEQLSRILQSAYGITHSWGGFDFRSAPSGGALYPIEVYVIATNVETLTQGLYHFQVSDSALELIKEGDFRKELYRAAFEQGAVDNGVANIIITSRWDRSTKKYADRGYRYTYVEAGAICQNIYLQTVSLGMGTVVIGAFNDDAVNRLLEIDGRDESVLLIMPVGFPE